MDPYRSLTLLVKVYGFDLHPKELYGMGYYDSYFLYLQTTVGVVTTERYFALLLYLVFTRTKIVTLPAHVVFFVSSIPLTNSYSISPGSTVKTN